MEYIDLGEIVNISASVPTAVDDVTYHVIMDFVPNPPVIFDQLQNGFSEILTCPDAWVLCHVGDITKAQDELLKLKDRVKELEGQLEDTKKEADKKLSDLKSKKVAKCTMEISDGKVSFIYTYMDGHNEACGIADSDGAVERLITKCKSCKNHRHFGNTFGHYCRIPNSNHIIPGMFDMYPLTDEEAEGPACDKFEARKE